MKENVIQELRKKSHWDFVLEEMAWLANDFMQVDSDMSTVYYLKITFLPSLKLYVNEDLFLA